MFERLAHRRRVRKRINELDVLINRSRMVRVAWLQERAFIESTGRLDWVDPNPMPLPRRSTRRIR